MEWFEYLIIVAVVLFVISVTLIAIRNKIKGKTSCGGNCSGCNKCYNTKQHLEEYLKSK